MQKTGLPKHWVSAIFKKFQVRYGNRWLSSIEGIEEFAITEWSKGLGGLSAEQLETGFDRCTSDWPPSLPEFVKMCMYTKPIGSVEQERLLILHNREQVRLMDESQKTYELTLKSKDNE